MVVYRWNFDDSIIAKLGNDCIYLYETRVSNFFNYRQFLLIISNFEAFCL